IDSVARPGKQSRLSNRETVVAGEDHVQPLAVRAHPFGGKACGISGPDVPILGEENGRPRAPRLRRVVDAEAACEARVGFVALSAGDDLRPEIALQCGVETQTGTVAAPCVDEDRAALIDVPSPQGLVPWTETAQELVSVALLELILRHSGQNHAV